MTTHNQYKVLLVGREGNGKRSCVNTIRPYENALNVIACEGVGDTGEDLKMDINVVIESVREEIEKCKSYGGVDAIGFVLKYGVRFTKQEKDAVDAVKSIFGRNVFRVHMFILFTYGDSFDLDDEDEPRDFQQWCRQQTGDIQSLFEEVDYRVVLLDNKTTDRTKLERQFNEFQQTIEKVKANNGIKKYTLANFKSVNGIEKSRDWNIFLYLFSLVLSTIQCVGGTIVRRVTEFNTRYSLSNSVCCQCFFSVVGQIFYCLLAIPCLCWKCGRRILRKIFHY